MPIETIIIDVYTSVYSASLGRVIKTGAQDVEVPKIEAEPWLGNYALLSSERVEEDEDDTSRPAKTPRSPRKKSNNKSARGSDGDVGGRAGLVG